MSVNQPATSGANVDTSGSATDSSVVPEPATSGVDSHVLKLKKEKDNYAKKVHELQGIVDQQAADKLAAEKDDLVKKEQYKTLYEQEKEKREGLESEVSANKVLKVESNKRAAIKKHLVGLGLNSEHEETAFKLMDSSSVFVDEETGVIVGAEDAAKSFYDQHKTLGLFGKQVPGVSHAAPASKQGSLDKPVGEMTVDEIKEFYKKISL